MVLRENWEFMNKIGQNSGAKSWFLTILQQIGCKSETSRQQY